MSKGVNSSAPTTAEVVGGVYNATPPVLTDGQATALQLDVNGKLITSGGGGGGGDVNITEVGGNPEGLNNPLPVELSDGTQAVGTPSNPLSVNVITGGGSNASVGATGTTAPTSATLVGGTDGTTLRGLSTDSTGKLNVNVSAIVADQVNQGSPNTPANSWPVEVTDGTNVLGVSAHPLQVSLANTAVNATAVKVDGSAVTQPVSGTLTVQQTTGTNLHVVVDSAPTTAVTLPAGQAVELLDGGGVNKATISAAGAIKVDGSAVTQPVSQGTAANLNATVVPGGSAIFEVSPTTAANTASNPFFQSITDGTNGFAAVKPASTAAVATDEALVVAISPNNTVPVSLASTTLTGTSTVAGNKTNNNAVPGATNVGALVAIANAAAPSYSEGNEVLLSTDLAGSLRANTTEWGGTAISAPPASGVPAVGTEVAPVVKPIQRKNTTVLFTNGANYTGSTTTSSAWVDTQQTGDVFVALSAILLSGNTSTATIQQTDDTSGNAAFIQTTSVLVDQFTLLFQASSAIFCRYWRIQWVAGASNGTCEVTATAHAIQTQVLAAGLLASGSTQSILIGASGQLIASSTNGQSAADGTQPPAQVMGGPPVVFPAYFNGSVLQRTPATFKTATVTSGTSGNSAVWTPASGKAFRLMRFQITGVNLAATAATVVTLSFQDNATGITIGTYDVLLPAATTATDVLSGGFTFNTGWVDLGNGILSAAANNVLHLNVSAAPAGATGSYRVNVCGTEE